MSKESVISNFIIYKLKNRHKKKKRIRTLFVFLLWGVSFLLRMIDVYIVEDMQPVMGLVLNIMQRFFAFLGGCGAGILVAGFLDEWKKISTVKKGRYIYSFETCIEVRNEEPFYKVRSNAGKEYTLLEELMIGDRFLFVGIERYGGYLYLLKDAEDTLFLNSVEEDYVQTPATVPVTKAKVTAKEFLIADAMVDNRVFIMLIVFFFIGFMAMLLSNLYVDGFAGLILRVCGCILEVLSILCFIRMYLKKYQADEKIDVLLEDRFTYRIECCVEVKKNLDKYQMLIYTVVTDYDHEYVLPIEVFIGDEILVADIDLYGERIFLLRRGNFRYEII